MVPKISLCLVMLSSSCFGMMQREVLHDDNGFKVRDIDGIHEVAYHNVSRDLQAMHKAQKVRDFIERGGKIRIAQLHDVQNPNNIEYGVREKVDGLGGGPGWCVVVAIVGYTSVGVASLGTLIATLPSGPGAIVAAAAVATAGTALVTKAVLVTAVLPTP